MTEISEWRFAVEQLMGTIADLKSDVKELRQDIKVAVNTQNLVSTQSVKLLAEHDVCRKLVEEHDKDLKHLQKFRIQILTIATTVQVVAFIIAWLLEKLITAGGAK